MNPFLERFTVQELLDSLELYQLSEYDLSELPILQNEAIADLQACRRELKGWQSSNLFSNAELFQVLQHKRVYCAQAQATLNGLRLVERVALYAETLPVMQASVKAFQFLALARSVQEGSNGYWTLQKGEWKRKAGAREKLVKLATLYGKIENNRTRDQWTQAETVLFDAVQHSLKFCAVQHNSGMSSTERSQPSAVGAAKSDFQRVVQNALASNWLKPSSAKAQADTPAGAKVLLPPAYPEESVERLEAIGEKPTAVKVHVKHNKLSPLGKRQDAQAPQLRRQPDATRPDASRPDSTVETPEAIKAEQLANYIQGLKDGLELAPVFIALGLQLKVDHVKVMLQLH